MLKSVPAVRPQVHADALLIQIAGAAGPRSGRHRAVIAQPIAGNQQQPSVTYRLKHASAVQLAPVLTNLFTGTGGFRGVPQQVFPNANGGLTVFNGANNQPPGNITTFNVPPQVQVNPGRGGGGGGGGVNAPGRGGGGANNQANNQAAAADVTRSIIQNALGNALQGAAGLSTQAGDIRVIAEETSNSLLIRATDSDWALIQQIVQGVDLRPLQVLIEVTIAEVQRTHDLDIGVSGSLKKTTNNGKNTTTISTTAPNSSTNARDFILQLTGGNGTITYDLAIAALQERGDVKVLSLPVIIAQNNRQAVLNVGSSRPFVQVSQTVPNDPTGRVQTAVHRRRHGAHDHADDQSRRHVNLHAATGQRRHGPDSSTPVINKREAAAQIFIATAKRR